MSIVAKSGGGFRPPSGQLNGVGGITGEGQRIHRQFAKGKRKASE